MTAESSRRGLWLVLLCYVLKPIFTGGTPVPRGMGILYGQKRDVCATRSRLNRVILVTIEGLTILAPRERKIVDSVETVEPYFFSVPSSGATPFRPPSDGAPPSAALAPDRMSEDSPGP